MPFKFLFAICAASPLRQSKQHHTTFPSKNDQCLMAANYESHPHREVVSPQAHTQLQECVCVGGGGVCSQCETHHMVLSHVYSHFMVM